jgi:hypothetical protein
VGDVYTDNGDLAILQGSGVGYPFGFTIGPRVWNGTVDYCTTTIGVEELKSSQVSVYPNPFHESVSFTFPDNKDRQIEIYNSTGEMVKPISTHESEFKLLRDGLSDGVYMYRVISDREKILSGKLIIF